MTIATGADIAAWMTAQSLTSVQAAPILGLSRRSIEGIVSGGATLTPSDAARANAGAALYAASPSTYPSPCE